MSLQAIIIGSSHAGANVAYNLRKDGFNGKIDIFTKEKIFPYHRPPLSKDFLKNHTPLDKLFFKPENSMQKIKSIFILNQKLIQ